MKGKLRIYKELKEKGSIIWEKQIIIYKIKIYNIVLNKKKCIYLTCQSDKNIRLLKLTNKICDDIMSGNVRRYLKLSRIKACKVCNKPLSYSNKQGFCREHLPRKTIAKHQPRIKKIVQYCRTCNKKLNQARYGYCTICFNNQIKKIKAKITHCKTCNKKLSLRYNTGYCIKCLDYDKILNLK